jgi:hypothetical protein
VLAGKVVAAAGAAARAITPALAVLVVLVVTDIAL